MKRIQIQIIYVLLIIMLTNTFTVQNPKIIEAKNEGFIQPLQSYIAKEQNLKGAVIGISIRSQETGELLYEYNGDKRLRPASNLKLLTGASALSVLGKDYRFQTSLLTNGKIKNNQINGNLYIKGGGDPTLLPINLQSLVSKLVEKGIDTITGDIIADDSWYDDVRYSQDLPWTDEYTYYGSQISALTLSPDKDYDSGTVKIFIKPSNIVGDQGMITVSPNTNFIKIINRTKTISGDSDLTIERVHGSNTVIVEGNISIHSSMKKEWISVWNPTKYTLEMFNDYLVEAGINHQGDLKVNQAPKHVTKIFTHYSMPISNLMTPFMKLSNNGHAEVMVKEMGKVIKGVGSWEMGLQVMGEELKRFGIDPSELVIRDGSGISHINLVPANSISLLLYNIQKEPWFTVFQNSLPVAGLEERMLGGSLRYRMTSPPLIGNVKAKTGTISTVSALSGYLETVNGEKLIFSLLLNNLVDEDYGKEIEDNIVEILATN